MVVLLGPSLGMAKSLGLSSQQKQVVDFFSEEAGFKK